MLMRSRESNPIPQGYEPYVQPLHLSASAYFGGKSRIRTYKFAVAKTDLQSAEPPLLNPPA